MPLLSQQVVAAHRLLSTLHELLLVLLVIFSPLAVVLLHLAEALLHWAVVLEQLLGLSHHTKIRVDCCSPL